MYSYMNIYVYIYISTYYIYIYISMGVRKDKPIFARLPALKKAETLNQKSLRKPYLDSTRMHNIIALKAVILGLEGYYFIYFWCLGKHGNPNLQAPSYVQKGGNPLLLMF